LQSIVSTRFCLSQSRGKGEEEKKTEEKTHLVEEQNMLLQDGLVLVLLRVTSFERSVRLLNGSSDVGSGDPCFPSRRQYRFFSSAPLFPHSISSGNIRRMREPSKGEKERERTGRTYKANPTTLPNPPSSVVAP
jgi:hypothetical protein